MPLALFIAATLLGAAPQVQTDMNRQATTDFRVADAALNAQYRRTMIQAQSRDRIRPRGEPGPTYAAALLAAQRAWIGFRDAECRVEAFQYRGGSAEAMAHVRCMASLTRQRTAQLATLQRSLTPL